MKNLKNMLFATAVVAISAGVASAEALKANIPFDFQAGGLTMPAGQYRLETRPATAAAHVYSVRSEASGKGILLIASNPIIAKNSMRSAPARLVFDCVEGGGCSLAEVWTGPESTGYRFSQPKTSHDREVRQASVLLSSGSAK